MIVNYFEVTANFELAPAEAIAFFQAKGLKPTFAWQDMTGEEHAHAFTIAKMMDTDLLKTVREKLDDHLAKGGTFADFRKELIPQLQAAGWWGKKDVLDPLTGQVVKAQLGSASRLSTIYRTNLQSAYAAGRWQAIEAQAANAPYLMYDAVDDHRTRPEHAALDNLVLPVGDPFWNTHAPTNGWNCRCGLIQIDKSDLQDLNLQVDESPPLNKKPWKNPRTGITYYVPEDLDPGWDYNPGKDRAEQIKKLAAEKAATLAKAEQAALQKAEKAMQAAVAKARAQAKADRELAKLAKLKAEQEAIAAAAAQEQAAQLELDQHLKDKTPFMAQAIKAVQGTKKAQGLTPTEILAAAKDKAAGIEKNALLTNYKQAKLKGGTPSAKAQAAFDSLPDEAQLSILADIDGKTGITAAKEELKKIGEGKADKQPGLKQKILAQWSKSGKAKDYPTVPELVTAIEKEAAAQQVKAEQASVLSGYKKKIMAGHVPTAKQMQVFNQLSDAEKAKFLDKIDQEKAKLAPPAPTPAPAPSAPQVPTPAAAVTAKTYGQLTDQEKYKVLYDIAGVEEAGDEAFPHPDDFPSLPKKEQGNYLDELTSLANDIVGDDDNLVHEVMNNHLEMLADNGEEWAILSGKAASAAGTKSVPKAPQLSMANMTQIGPQKGSNPGGLYQDTATGIKYYIKEPPTADHAKNEVLTAKLYEAAGIDVPELFLVTEGGTTRVASKIIDGVGKDAAKLADGKVVGATQGFAVDAWLANWDVIGLDFDNLLVKGNKAYRVDTGAGLLYRAQGAKKGADFGSVVVEIDTLRNTSKNANAAAVFGKMTDADITTSVQLVSNIDDKTIRQLVDDFGPGTAAERKKLADTLIARKKDLLKRFPGAGAAKVTPQHLQVARENEAGIRLELETIDNLVVAAIKGIAKFGETGIRKADTDRVASVRSALQALIKGNSGLLTKDSLDEINGYYGPWLANLEAAVAGGEGSVHKWTGGFYTPFKGAVKVDPARVSVPEPGKITFTEAQAKSVIKEALGKNAAAITVPDDGTSRAFDNITEGHKQAISVYTASHYRRVNDALREGTATPRMKRYADLLTEALENSTPYKGLSARGLNLSGQALDQFIKGHEAALAKGTTVVHNGFISSTKGSVPAFGGNVVLQIQGKNGVWVNPISVNKGTENEVLLKHRSEFRVTDMKKTGVDQWVIYLEEV